MEKHLKAYAKINLFLDVVGKREDGYHDLNMIMLPLELHDTIFIEPIAYLRDDYITCDHVELQETKYNLISATLKEMKKRYGYNDKFNIIIHKEIPISAGLGGGSSNSAAVIKYLEEYKKLNLPKEEELDLAKSLGCDVPYCLLNKPAHVTGVGEKIELIPMKKQFYVLVVKPLKGCSTKKVFALADEMELEHSDPSNVIKALADGDEELLSKSVFNSLEKASATFVPEIYDVEKMLRKDGFKVVLMSGSGSSVVALTLDKKLVTSMYRKYEKLDYDVILTKTLR